MSMIKEPLELWWPKKVDGCTTQEECEAWIKSLPLLTRVIVAPVFDIKMSDFLADREWVESLPEEVEGDAYNDHAAVAALDFVRGECGYGV